MCYSPQSVGQLTMGQVDLVSPLEVSVGFPPIARPTPTYIGGDPVRLVDYRDVPVLIVEGNTSISVSTTHSTRLASNLYNYV